MKLQLVTYESTSHYKEPVFRIIGSNDTPFFNFPLKTLSPKEVSENDFLCLTIDNRTFVSSVNFTESLGYYVDDVRGKICIPVLELKEIHLIQV